MTRTRTNGNSFSNSVVTGTEGKSATLKSLCSSVYRVDTKTYQPSDIRWLFIQARLNCYIICKTLPSEKKREIQRAKKVVSDSPGLVDFAIGLVNSVFNLPDGQVMFYEEFE